MGIVPWSADHAENEEPAVDTQSPYSNSTVLSLASFDQCYVRRPRRWLVLVLFAYLTAAISYAVLTPAWQNPDEPAHYNYVAYVAAHRSLPVLHFGDYDQSLLDHLLATRFAPMFSTADLQYEFYQPPLYYIVAAPVYWLSGGNLLALRLFNVLLGVIGLYLLYRCTELVFPHKTLISVGAVAFAALLPMHVAMSAAVNNDGMAELLILASLFVLLQWMYAQFYGLAPLEGTLQRRRLIALGLLLGLGLLTKAYAYALLPLCLAVVAWVAWRRPRVNGAHGAAGPIRLGRGLAMALWAGAPALALGLPLWIRNMRIYGGWDVLALNWHDYVVVGQPRTSEWIAQHGWVEFSERALEHTFQSFWGVFGWMGVFMDARIYLALSVFAGILFAGLLWAVVRLIAGPPDTDMDFFQVTVLALFAIMLAAVIAGYIAYNLKFVQHQGRYFFWGLLPISTLVALGWREVLYPLQGWITGLLAAVLALALAATGLLSGNLVSWPVFWIGSAALLLTLQPLLLGDTELPNIEWLPAWYRRQIRRPQIASTVGVLRSLVWALPFALLWLLNLAIPWLYVLPQLTVN